MNEDKTSMRKLSPETILTHFGRRPSDHFGFVNTPVYHGSTIVFQTRDELEEHKSAYR